MAIAFEDADTGKVGASGGVTVTPAGGAAASGEVVYVAVSYEASSVNTWPSAYTLSGFTQVAQISTTGSFTQLTLFRKIAGASEPTSYTVTWTAGAFYSVVGAALVLSGVHATTPDGTPITFLDPATDTNYVIPALTTTAADSWDLVVISPGGGTNPGAGIPFLSAWGSSLIERADYGNNYAGIGIATALRAAAGVQAATNVTAINSDLSIAIRVEVFAAGGAPAGQPAMKRGRGVPGMRLGGTTFGQGF